MAAVIWLKYSWVYRAFNTHGLINHPYNSLHACRLIGLPSYTWPVGQGEMAGVNHWPLAGYWRLYPGWGSKALQRSRASRYSARCQSQFSCWPILCPHGRRPCSKLRVFPQCSARFPLIINYSPKTIIAAKTQMKWIDKSNLFMSICFIPYSKIFPLIMAVRSKEQSLVKTDDLW